MKQHRRLLALGLSLFLTLLPSPSPAHAGPFQWQLDNVDIRLVIQQVAALTGKQFIVDPRVQGKVQLYAAEAKSDEEILDLFYSMLSVMGYTAQTRDQQIHILPQTDSSVSASVDANANIRLYVIPIKYHPVATLISTLKPLLPAWAQLQPVASANQLIYAGDARTLENLQQLLTKVDVAPAQVSVQALIAQVDIQALQNLGLSWESLVMGGRGDLRSGVTGGTDNFFVSWQVILNALAKQQRAEILAQPVLTILHQQTAHIEVGQRVSIQQSATGSNEGLGLPVPVVNTFARENVSMSLTIKPTMINDEQIELQIQHHNNTLVNPNDPGVTPQVNVSQLQTQVRVRDQETIVLGGLMQNQHSDEVRKVPLLAELPGIGRLFQLHRTHLRQKLLLILLRPQRV